MEYAIEVKGLTKRFDDFTAVDNISFGVEKEAVFGFLGPNGAGKTTTTRMLTGISTPTAGTARIMGYDIQKQSFRAKEQMGVVTDISNVYNDLTAWQNLIFTGKLYGLHQEVREDRAHELLDMFGLEQVRDENVREFSGGMRRRLTIAMALINDASVLFLDEPTTALDVQSVRIIRELIRKLNNQGKTIFLTTHNMAEANELCTEIAIINQGRIGTIGTPEKLKQAMDRVHSVEVIFENRTSQIIRDLGDLNSVREVEKRGDKVRLYTTEPSATLSEVFAFAEDRNLKLISVNTLSPTLEDVFLELTGEKIVKRREQGKVRAGGRGRPAGRR
ncbi:MAG: ATP-binding cassette domain-containing protein [Candidatus Thorarchaeota archaeon]